MKPNAQVDQAVQAIDRRIEKIWNQPPAELKNLLEVKGPCRQSFNPVMYAYGDANALAGILWNFRLKAKEGIPIGPLAILTGSILESYAKSFEAYGLWDTAALLRQGAKAQAEMKGSGEYIHLAERLIVYLNRLGMAGWLDLMMPWKELGDAFTEALRSRTFHWGAD